VKNLYQILGGREIDYQRGALGDGEGGRLGDEEKVQGPIKKVR